MKHSINRRDFLQRTAALGASTLLTQLPAAAMPAAKAGFKLVVLATDWGFPGSRDALCQKAKAAGYDGIEVWWPGSIEAQNEIFDAVEKHGMEVGFLASGGSNEFTKHASTFETTLLAATGNKRKKPLYVNCHSGRDYYTEAQNGQLIDITTRISKASGVPIYHETHRARMMFAAHITRRFIETKPDLRLTLDISHWCNVHESYLTDQAETVALALQRVGHIHARIGHPEGPQVNDPRAPEWEHAVKAHFAWWDEVAKIKRAKGEVMTMLTEFGPADYMPTLPYTRQPVADQWAINVHMKDLLKARYGA
ncbi:sugar phosphate isomerase/epimerase family protein [Chitinophaga deserti]|uniref:sugar phosphate isomerase/epimerase family protein n=1 Tax=Chitinophaga deserti TaxID=2164099 RepID=UPI000D6C2B8F|nr:twin-arginine translocation signal domain-containing protein [Chitinophaga deserti]